jgi:hypothetical protein
MGWSGRVFEFLAYPDQNLDFGREEIFTNLSGSKGLNFDFSYQASAPIIEGPFNISS